MIRLNKIHKTYGDSHILKDVSLEVQKGETLILLGRSGCGKTTLLKMINRLITPSSGEVYIDKKNILEYEPVTLRRNIGYVFQNIGLFPHMTIYENLVIVPTLLRWKKNAIKKRLSTIQEVLQINSNLLNRKPSQLSGGQCQRIGVGRALMGNPEIILMDEPFGALDPITREEIQDEFLSIKQMINKTIVFVTHDIYEAFMLGDKICLIENGEIAQLATLYDMLCEPANDFVAKFIGRHRGSLLYNLKNKQGL